MEAKSLYDSKKAYIEGYKREANRAKNQIEGLEFLMLRYMQESGREELIVGPFRLTITTSERVTDPPPGTSLSRWEDKFIRVSYAPDKKAIKAAHKAGQPIPPQVEIQKISHLKVNPMRKKGDKTDD